MHKEGYYGVIGDNYQETDYQIGADLVLPKPRKTFYDNTIEYNQDEVQKYSCTIHGAIGALSDLSGYKFTLDERKELLKQAIEKGFNTSKGWYVNKAVDLVRNFWDTKNANDTVNTYQLELCSTDFYNAINKGYTVVCSFKGNRAYTTDKADGILDDTDFGVSTYGHCIRVLKGEDEKYIELMIDNYAGGVNRYKVSKENLEKLVKNKVFYISGYIFIFKNDTTTESVVPAWAAKAIEKAVAKGMSVDLNTINTPFVCDKAIEETLFKLGILTQKTGTMTMARWLVALDKLKAFTL